MVVLPPRRAVPPEQAEELRTLLKGEVRQEAPNDKVNDCLGQLCLEGQEPVMLSRDNMLLRGCQLRNTEWVLGLVVASGVHTKINFVPSAGEACSTACSAASSAASSPVPSSAWRAIN